MIELDIPEIQQWAVDCGTIAKKHFRKVQANQKADRSYVTAADLEIEALLVERLSSRYPSCGIIGEETTRNDLDREYVWAIDPIDGTGAFVHGLPVWGISIGLLHHGNPHFGLFYMPIADDMYWNEPNQTSFCNNEQIRVIESRQWHTEDWIAIPSNAHRRYHIDFSGKARSFGSSVADICYVARGSALAGLLTRCAIWDLAAGLAILNDAGGAYCGLSGAEPDIPAMARDGSLLREPLLIANPSRLATLREHISAL